MMCEELSPEYGAYAFGIAEDPERAEIAAHLARACPVCSEGVRGAMGIVAAMSGAVTLVDPPKRLRGRIAGMVSRESRRSWPLFVPWGVAAVLAVVLASIVVPPRLNPPVPEQKLDEALSILNDPATKDVSFGEPAARGRVFVSPDKGVVVMAAHLPALAANKTFELWLIPARGNPIPSGTFRGNADSTAIYVRPGPVTNAAAVAVSVEPAGGSPQPTTTPFIVAKL
jgi:phosphoribosylcarboxyaminoimidazole (NCAIR) mutase